MAARSATECAAILDVCRKLWLAQEPQLLKGRELLLRIVSMLTALSKSMLGKGGEGAGAGKETGEGRGRGTNPRPR